MIVKFTIVWEQCRAMFLFRPDTRVGTKSWTVRAIIDRAQREFQIVIYLGGELGDCSKIWSRMQIDISFLSTGTGIEVGRVR